MSCVTNRLVFDPTSTLSSHNVGAYVRAGTDGDLIGSETLNALEWLRTSGPIIDSSGNEVAVTSNALDVNIAAATGLAIYAEDSAHTTADDGQFVMSVRVDDLTAVPAGALAGTELDYQAFITGPNGELLIGADQLDIDDLNATDDAVSAWTKDGSGNSIGSTAGSLDVNVTNSIDLDDDLADTAIQTESVAVSTTAVNAVTSLLAARKHLGLANEGNKSLYFGPTGVTTANGFPLHPGMQQVWRIGPSVTPQIIGETGASAEDLRNIQLS